LKRIRGKKRLLKRRRKDFPIGSLAILFLVSASLVLLATRQLR